MKKQKIKIIDIGHQNLRLDSAISLLGTTMSEAIYEGETKAIKVITGHGSGKLRESVRLWLHEQEGRFQAVIYGEDYHVFNKYASDMRAECNVKNDPDFGKKNSGVTYVWLW